MSRQEQARKPTMTTTEPDRVQFSIINLKGTVAYRDWLVGLSKKTHIPAASIVRLALAEWAERNGHATPPGR